jgi:hypothetical protein
MRRFLAWGAFGLIVLIGISIIASLLFFGLRNIRNILPLLSGLLLSISFWILGAYILDICNLLGDKMDFLALERRKLASFRLTVS